MELYHLQCMDQTEPVGVDTRRPCFSWKVKAGAEEETLLRGSHTLRCGGA